MGINHRREARECFPVAAGSVEAVVVGGAVDLLVATAKVVRWRRMGAVGGCGPGNGAAVARKAASRWKRRLRRPFRSGVMLASEAPGLCCVIRTSNT
jgi:hypothetical protein